MTVQNLTPENLTEKVTNKDHYTPTPSLAALLDLTASDMGRINDLILQKAHSSVDMIPELASHLINSGGKRIRPMLTCATARLCNYEGLDHIPLATSIEFLHTATLLHDDVVDESDMRRGKKQLVYYGAIKPVFWSVIIYSAKVLKSWLALAN